MTAPERIDDDTLEWAASIVEDGLMDEISLGGRRRRKREREDQALVLQTRLALRQELARRLRGFSGRRDLEPLAMLARLSNLAPEHRHDHELRDAWPLAWRGLVKITAAISCASNSVPPECEYKISLTKRGREMLAAADVSAKQI